MSRKGSAGSYHSLNLMSCIQDAGCQQDNTNQASHSLVEGVLAGSLSLNLPIAGKFFLSESEMSLIASSTCLSKRKSTYEQTIADKKSFTFLNKIGSFVQRWKRMSRSCFFGLTSVTCSTYCALTIFLSVVVTEHSFMARNNFYRWKKKLGLRLCWICVTKFRCEIKVLCSLVKLSNSLRTFSWSRSQPTAPAGKATVVGDMME